MCGCEWVGGWVEGGGGVSASVGGDVGCGIFVCVCMCVSVPPPFVPDSMPPVNSTYFEIRVSS